MGTVTVVVGTVGVGVGAVGPFPQLIVKNATMRVVTLFISLS